MNIKRILGKTNPLNRLQYSHALCNIHQSKEFQDLIDHERSRSDRSGREFSVIVFYLSRLNGNGDASIDFINSLAGRIRKTEELGWLNGNSDIAVLLPDTPFKGAEKLAHDLWAFLHETAIPPAYNIYTYPNLWFPDSNNHAPQDNGSASADPHKTGRGQNLEVISESLEPLLEQRIPFWKRTMDILCALAGMIVLSPVFLFITVLIKSVSPGPVIFKQERVGFLGRTFFCWKFRTMKVDADPSLHENHVAELISNGKPLKKLDDEDQRIIPFGRILRKTCLDELPQLINVLRGEMSLVGPRPDVPYAVKNYQQWQNRRADTYPGLTGLWQINGKNKTTYNEMIRMDIKYVSQRSLWMDSKILLLTIPSIIYQIIDGSQGSTLSKPNRILDKGLSKQ